ncbi:carbohydrate sulfotransferase 11-like isoform X2 [Oratosquilla oratoria]|uniref:carbohydrate sulfotransferase 11-like isoform X2 n=1 Tax=Oratosquilla oratoria TaxID=337810 RepID=UPI003F76C372
MEGKGTGHSLRRHPWKRLRYVLQVFLLATFFLCLFYALLPSRQVYILEDKQGDSMYIRQQKKDLMQGISKNLTENYWNKADMKGEKLLQKSKELKFDEEPKRRSDELRATLKRICALLNISRPVDDYQLNHMHVDDENQVLYCYVPKVACTSWKRIWMKLIGVVEPTTNISTIDRFRVHTSLPTLLFPEYENWTKDILKTYKKFMFTRHPFDRVLSAFKDKLESEDKKSGYNFHDEIGTKIEKRYRGHEMAKGHNVTFSEFIRFISEPGYGTFEQRNEHWLSVHEVCNPCTVDYDFIGKYETLKEDSEYVLKWMGISDLIGPFPSSDRPFHAHRYKKDYFDQLGHDEKVAFFSKYLVDFLAFDYNFFEAMPQFLQN